VQKNGTPISLTAIITPVTQYHNIKFYFQIGTGFSDDDLQKHTTFFKQHVIPQPRPYYRYDSQHEPDHWFDAVQVWEIKCADLSLSPVHRAAIGIVSMMSSYTCVCVCIYTHTSALTLVPLSLYALVVIIDSSYESEHKVLSQYCSLPL